MGAEFNNRRGWGWIWWCLLLAALAYFLVRGPWRAVHDSGDFLTIFAASRCWLHGMNPYAPADLAASAQAAGVQVSENQFLSTPSVYLPPALLLFSPLALLSWTVAKTVWLFCSLGAVWFGGSAVVRMAKVWSVPIWSVLLAFAPLHTGISKGQPSVVVCVLIILSLLTPQPYVAGLLLGLAACIKPQLALGFVILAIGLRQGRKLLAAGATGVVAGGIAWLAMKPGSLAVLMANLSAVGSAAGINSGSALNPVRYQLINIDTLIPASLYSLPAVAAVYAVIVLVSAVAVARAAADTRVVFAVVASATVLLGYHRFYDAQILWLCVPAMFAVPQRLGLWMVAPLWISFAAFLIPGQTLAAKWLNPQTDNLGSILLLRHEALAALVVWLIFVVAAVRAGARQRASEGGDLACQNLKPSYP